MVEVTTIAVTTNPMSNAFVAGLLLDVLLLYLYLKD